jgi:hypothetical protein
MIGGSAHRKLAAGALECLEPDLRHVRILLDADKPHDLLTRPAFRRPDRLRTNGRPHCALRHASWLPSKILELANLHESHAIEPEGGMGPELGCLH